MWILPKNLSLDTLASAQDTKVSDLDSEQFSQICAKSLTWRGKDSLSRTWLQRWKRVSWMQHLFLRTLRPSLTDAFVDAWTSSLAASPANHLAPLESEQLPKTPGTCSPASPEGSENASQELFSSKTWKEFCPAPQEMVNPFSSMSLELWKKWVIGQRQAYSARKKLAHRTGGSGSSSWATPTAFDSGGNLVRTPEKLVQTRVETNAGCMNLREQVHYPEMDHSLKAAKNWPTVTVGEEKYRIKGNSQASKCLSAMAVRGELGQHDQASSSTNGKSLESWPTPQTSDYNAAADPTRKDHRTQLRDVETNHLPRGREHGGPQDQESRSTSGKSHALSPDWVEQLMGLPTGWTDCDYSETGLSQPPQP